MQTIIKPGKISGVITASPSKSSMQRACAAALLHKGFTNIYNPGKSNDDKAALDVIEKMGAIVEWHGSQYIRIKGSDLLSSEKIDEGKSIEINCGESGLGLRMFTPIAAISSNKIIISGTGSLLNRPMDFFDTIFPQLKIQINSNHGKLPITIQGPLIPKEISIDGSLSSQFLTGLLFAFGKVTTHPVLIRVNNLKSTPYIDLTLSVMQQFGYRIAHKNYEEFLIEQSEAVNEEMNYTVEGDWSGAAFLLVAGAVAGSITVKGLDVFSTQADKAILQALMSSKAMVSITEEEVQVSRPIGNGALQPFQFDATDCPDLFPPLAVLAANCNGVSVIQGVNRLTHKESNRGLTLKATFETLGINIELQDDLMIIHGGSVLKGGVVHSHHDHRIAMAAAVAALNCSDVVTIEEAEAINKSFPDFYSNLLALSSNQ